MGLEVFKNGFDHIKCWCDSADGVNFFREMKKHGGTIAYKGYRMFQVPKTAAKIYTMYRLASPAQMAVNATNFAAPGITIPAWATSQFGRAMPLTIV